MNTATQDTIETLPPPPPSPETDTVGWSDVIEASTEAQREPDRKTVTDVIRIPMTEAMLAQIAILNADDDAEKKDLVDNLERLKAEVKDIKADIESIEKRVSERNQAVRDKAQDVKGEWIVEDCFDQNETRWIDPTTGLIVKTEAIKSEKRQLMLDLDGANGVASDVDARAESNGVHEADDDFDDGTNLDSEDGPDRSATDVTDPDEVLAADGENREPERSEPPSRPIKRGRKGKKEVEA